MDDVREGRGHQTDFDPVQVPSEEWPDDSGRVRDAHIAVDTHLELEDVRSALGSLDGSRSS